MAEEPFCRLCLLDGRHVASDEVDHIVSLANGGSDERSNKQGLCRPCHEAKSAAERLEARHGGSRSGSVRRG
jgi:5-methylcytosine-specific restriction enzyme A